MSEIIQYGQAFAALENIRNGRFLSLQDDFVAVNSQVAAIGFVGENLAYYNSDTHGLIAGNQSHPGVFRFGPAPNPAEVSLIYTLDPAVGGSWLIADIGYMKAIINPLQGTIDMGFLFGVTQGTNADETGDGIYFSFQPTISPNFRTVTQRGGIATINTSTVAWILGTWYQLEILRIPTGIAFYINGGLEATHTTHITTNIGVDLTMQIRQDNNIENKILDLDFWQIASILPLAQRY